MNYKDLSNLIKLVRESDLSEFRMRDGEFRLTIRTDKYVSPRAQGNTQSAPMYMQMPGQPAATQSPPAQVAPQKSAATVTDKSSGEEEKTNKNYLEVRSPIVGTFYRSPSPDKDPFVKVGDTISEGDTVCIVEAMKLFNEIETEVSGKIVKVMVDDASPVEFDQVLFLVEPQ